MDLKLKPNMEEEREFTYVSHSFCTSESTLTEDNSLGESHVWLSLVVSSGGLSVPDS